MSLLELHPDSSLSNHDAPSGDDYTRGSSYMIWTTLAAAVVITAAVAIFYMVIHKPPVAAGEVSQVWVHGVHTISSDMDAAGVPTGESTVDQILIFAKVRVHNQSDKPIILREMLSNVTFEDGPRSSYGVTATDYNRIFLAYPELAGLRAKNLTRDMVIQPGETLEGMLVSAFHASKEQWAARKDLTFTLQFQSHPDLVLTSTTPVIEQ